MFEHITYEYLLNDVLSKAPDGIDTRQGSIFFDAVSGPLMHIARLYVDLDNVVKMISLLNATGEALDARAAEYGVYRLDPTPARYYVTFEGTVPDLGERFFTDGLYFVLVQDDETGAYLLEAEAPGIASNEIYAGTNAVPVVSIAGLASATFGDLYESGTDAEEDDDLRRRAFDKVGGPAENGNRQHYKTWCESVDGVGRARIFPLWNGENTIKAVLIDSVGTPCSASKVAEVQEYVDPADKGYTTEVNGITYVVGDGLGNGVANLGSHFTASAALGVDVNISFHAEPVSGASADTVQQEAYKAIADYIADLALETDDEKDVIVRVSQIGAILSSLSSLVDYTGLTVNGGVDNIRLKGDYIPVIGEVVVT